MPVIISALSIGLILSLLAIGVFISYRIFDFPDITADGSLTTGAAVAALLIVEGVDPLLATFAAVFGGFIAGTLTGLLHARFGINKLLSGILVMIALYSINIRIMGASHIPLLYETTIMTRAETVGRETFSQDFIATLEAAQLSLQEIMVVVMSLVSVSLYVFITRYFFNTRIGLAMRAAGNNPRMVRAIGMNDHVMLIIGLAISNGLIALSGAMYAQYLGYADIQLGIGMIVFGLASVIIGETVMPKKNFGWLLVSAVIGSVLFRLAVAGVLQAGLPQQDLKLVTALFVFAALILPRFARRSSREHVKAA